MINLKKAVSFFLSLTMLAATPAAVTLYASEPAPALVFEKNRGDFPIRTKTTNAEYLFETDDEELNSGLVRYAEAIINKSKELRLTSPTPQISFTSNDEKTLLRTVKVVINPESTYSVGAIVSFMSRGVLPAWLCAGLELNWLESLGMESPALTINKSFDAGTWATEATEKGLPHIDDAWFVPGLIKDELSKDAHQAVYAFVKYLDEQDVLTELISMYTYVLSDKIPQANKLAEKYQAEFTGLEETPEVFTSHYFYSYFDSKSAAYTKMMKVYKEQAAYSFIAGDWGYDMLIRYIDMMEGASVFVKDWFDSDRTKPFAAELALKRHPGDDMKLAPGFSFPYSSYYIYEIYDYFAHTAAHEITHLIAVKEGI